MERLTCGNCIYFCKRLNGDLDMCGYDKDMICNRFTPACCCFEDYENEEE